MVILVPHSTSMSSAAGTEQPAAPAQSTEHGSDVPTFESYNDKRIELQSHLSSLIDATVLQKREMCVESVDSKSAKYSSNWYISYVNLVFFSSSILAMFLP